jgi:hypothetical protein
MAVLLVLLSLHVLAIIPHSPASVAADASCGSLNPTSTVPSACLLSLRRGGLLLPGWLADKMVTDEPAIDSCGMAKETQQKIHFIATKNAKLKS